MDEYQDELRRNIKRLYALAVTNGGGLFALPIFVVFFQAHDLTMTQIFIVQAVFSLGVVLFEIPSGYFSDYFGRKPTIIIGTAAWFLGYLIYCLSGTFWGFIVAELFIAVGDSFLSGTTEAMTYDTLLELKEEKNYRRIIGHQSFLHFGSEAFIGVLGGLIALISLRAPFVATLPFLAVGFLIALSLHEPARHKIQETQHLKVIWNVCTHTLFKNPALRSITLLHAVISTMTLSLFWLTQPFELMVEIPLIFFGVVHGSIVLIGAIASKATHTIARFIDDRLFLILVAVAVAGSYIALGFVTTIGGLGLFLVGRIAWGFLTPLTSDLTNRMTTSDVRATTLSIRGFLSRIIFAFSIPLIGSLMDASTLPETMLMVGLIGAGILGLLFLLIRPVWKMIPA